MMNRPTAWFKVSVMLDPDSLATHADRIRASEILGRSTRLLRLFDFLVECSASGKVPKEADIAIDVFRRTASFDSSQDAAVRVYVHKLRRRLEDFYTGPGAQEQHRLVLARGEYRLVLEQVERAEPEMLAAVPMPGELPPPPPVSRRLQYWLAGILGVSLLLNVLIIWSPWRGVDAGDDLRQVRNSQVWAPIMKDDLPVTIVVGDYYIFGETDDSMEVKRMVREFGINSRLELEEYAHGHPEASDHYLDLDLTYLPTSVAPALRELLPILAARNKRVQVELMSELTPGMLTHSDIIYVGYLSGLGMLHDIVFAGSSFSVGRTYDEIVHNKTGQHYLSQGGSPWRGDTKYKDYGYLSTFAGPSGNHVVIISGTRDVAVANTAEMAARPRALEQLARQAGDKKDFEALYEVYGVDHANVDSRLLITSALNTNAMWRN